MGKVLRFPSGTGGEPPVDRRSTLEAGMRSFLAVEDALAPWSDSNLISRLAGATGEEREAILRELEERGR